jgi:hypothetical protein
MPFCQKAILETTYYQNCIFFRYVHSSHSSLNFFSGNGTETKNILEKVFLWQQEQRCPSNRLLEHEFAKGRIFSVRERKFWL